MTRSPAVSPLDLRIGGFGGADGLADYLRANRIDALVDATHPYAEAISAHAAAACKAAKVPHLVLHRAPWTPEPGGLARAAPGRAVANMHRPKPRKAPP